MTKWLHLLQRPQKLVHPLHFRTLCGTYRRSSVLESVAWWVLRVYRTSLAPLSAHPIVQPLTSLVLYKTQNTPMLLIQTMPPSPWQQHLPKYISPLFTTSTPTTQHTMNPSLLIHNSSLQRNSKRNLEPYSTECTILRVKSKL